MFSVHFFGASNPVTRFCGLQPCRSLCVHGRLFNSGLTFASEKARDAWRLANHSAFHMRRDWLDKGVRLRAATPGNLHATVGSIDKFMGRFVVGVNDEKRSAGSGIFIPKYDAIDDVGTHTDVRRTLRNMARTKSKPFWRNGMLLRRLGKGQDAPLTVVGFIRDRVKIEPRLDAVEIVDALSILPFLRSTLACS